MVWLNYDCYAWHYITMVWNDFEWYGTVYFVKVDLAMSVFLRIDVHDGLHYRCNFLLFPLKNIDFFLP